MIAIMTKIKTTTIHCLGGDDNGNDNNDRLILCLCHGQEDDEDNNNLVVMLPEKAVLDNKNKEAEPVELVSISDLHLHHALPNGLLLCRPQNKQSSIMVGTNCYACPVGVMSHFGTQNERLFFGFAHTRYVIAFLDSVGMTNPVLQVTPKSNNHPQSNNLNWKYDASSSSASVSLTSSSASTFAEDRFQLEDDWIPASTTTTNTNERMSNHEKSTKDVARVLKYKLVNFQQQMERSRQRAEHAWFPMTNNGDNDDDNQKKKWRQCRYRRRVGQGQACYERVRDAALEWQFSHTQHPTKGILPVGVGTSSSSSGTSKRKKSTSGINHNHQQDSFSLDEDASKHVQCIWAGPHLAASRRLVTFTTCGFKSSWLPKLYTMNPVMVVYDLLDQRYVLKRSGSGISFSGCVLTTDALVSLSINTVDQVQPILLPPMPPSRAICCAEKSA